MKNELETYLESRFRLNTIRGVLNEIKLYMLWSEKDNIQIEAANYNDILTYINYCREKGNSKRTIRSKLNCLKHYYDYLQASQEIQINPAIDIRLKNVEKSIIPAMIKYEEFEKLYQDYPTNGILQKRNKCILGLLIYQGLNTSELNKLEIKDVKLEEGKIYIPSMAKSNSRILKLESHQIIQLQNYIFKIRPVLLTMTEKNTDQLFISTGKTGIKNPHNIFSSVKYLLEYLRKMEPKIKDAKQIRASIINHWLKQYNIRQVQYMIGHKYVSSTERYNTNKLESLQEQIGKLHPFR
jgi:integrase/recombinase XerD